MTYTRPTKSKLPAALAEVMGWPMSGPYVLDRNEPPCRLIWCIDSRMRYSENCPKMFEPLTDRNHSRIAVERCVELGLMQRYSYHIASEVGQMGSDPSIVAIILATPAQESYAAHRTLCEHRIAEAKEPK